MTHIKSAGAFSNSLDDESLILEMSPFLRDLDNWISATVTRDAVHGVSNGTAASILEKYECAVRANLEYFVYMKKCSDKVGQTSKSSYYRLMAEIYQSLLPVPQKEEK